MLKASPLRITVSSAESGPARTAHKEPQAAAPCESSLARLVAAFLQIVMVACRVYRFTKGIQSPPRTVSTTCDYVSIQASRRKCPSLKFA